MNDPNFEIVSKGIAYTPGFSVDPVSGNTNIEGLGGYGATMGPDSKCIHCDRGFGAGDSVEVRLRYRPQWSDAVFEHRDCRIKANEPPRDPNKHYCAEFTYKNECGAEIIADGKIYPLSEMKGDGGRPISEFGWENDLQGWDRIDVHGFDIQEGITSGHVYKFVDDGVVIGDVLLMW